MIYFDVHILYSNLNLKKHYFNTLFHFKSSPEKDTSLPNSLNASPNKTNLVHSSPSAVSGGVNRRTAVLFTRKAKARQSRGQAHRTSPENDNKKESDSFRVYRYFIICKSSF